MRPKIARPQGPSSRGRAALAVLLACLLGTPAAPLLARDRGPAGPAVEAGDGAIVASIQIRGNRRTRDEVIRRELLFEVGSRLDSAAVAETERNLRALLYLGRIAIRAQPAAPGSTLVVVEVEDLYSRALSPLLAGDSQELSFGVVALDYNLLGRGRVGQLTLFRDAVAGNRAAALYRDPRLAGTRLGLSAQAAWAEEGHDAAVWVSRPFYALRARWAYGVSAARHASRVRLYRGGVESSRYDSRSDAASLWLTRSGGSDLKVRPGLRLDVSDQSFDADAPFSYQPADRRRVLPGLSLTVWQPRYVTDRYVDLLGPEEDIQVGSWVAARLGLSARALGSDRGYAYLALTVAPRHRFTSGLYVLGSASASTRWGDGRSWHRITSLRLALHQRLRQCPLAPTVAARFAFDTLSRPEDAGSQFLLGDLSGLRGYGPRPFDGTRRLAAGAELRPLLQRRAHWVLGAALFADVGSAWTPPEGDMSLHPAAGAGLRLGLPRLYNTPILRADVARGLRGGLWQLSVGLGQYL